MKTETWCGHKIRFVEHDGEWWAVLADVAGALSLRTNKVHQRLSKDVLSKYTLSTAGGPQAVLIVNEFGIYEAIFESRKPEAKAFKRWVFDIIKALRQATGLEAFQAFRMLDIEHQKEAMKQLHAGLSKPVRVDFIKANTIANKAVSNVNGFPKMIKKANMLPEMLVQRQPILDDVVNLMTANESFGLGLSVSKVVYGKYHA